jgi:hypothetical protein
MRVERERLLFSCSAILFSCSLAPCLSPILTDPRENVDRPHQRKCMQSVACVEPQHSGSVRLATSVCGFQAREYPLLYSPSFLTLSLALRQTPNTENRAQRRLDDLSKDHSGSCPTIHAQNPIPRIFVTPKKVGHLTSSGHQSPAAAVHYAKRACRFVQ